MFTPPPSPMSSQSDDDDSSSTSLSPLSVTTPETEFEYPFPAVDSHPPKSSCIPEAGPSRLPLDVKKRIGRRTLFFVALLPTVLILTASLHHFLPPPLHDEPLFTFSKREPQPLSAASLAWIPSASPYPATIASSPYPTTTTFGSASGQSSPTTTSGASGQSSATTTSSASSQSLAPTPTSPGTAPSPVSSGLPTVPTSPTLPTPFPQPFDLALTSNFSTQGCAAFFANFTQAQEFRRCRAFSFLLNASSAFLQAQHNLTLFNDILFGTCNTIPTAAACADTLSSYLTQLNDVCRVDISDQNAAVLQAQIGFQSFTAMREASCLQDPSTNAYCYMNAVAATSPGDIYFYALPLGASLPNNTKPSCSPCVKSVLSVYSQYVNATPGAGAGVGGVGIGAVTGNSTGSTVRATPLPALSKTYSGAARLAIDQCGGTYATIGVVQPNAAMRYRIAWSAILLAVIVGSLAP